MKLFYYKHIKPLLHFKSLFYGYIVLVLSPFILYYFNDCIKYYDNVASLALAFFLIAELNMVNFKYGLSKQALREHDKGVNVVFEKILSIREEEERKELLENFISVREFGVKNTPHGYENVDLADKAFEKTETYIFIGIFFSTIIWGFAGLIVNAICPVQV